MDHCQWKYINRISTTLIIWCQGHYRECQSILLIRASIILDYFNSPFHDDVIKSKNFPRYRQFMRGIPRTKARDAEFWYFLRSGHWINGWVNSREAGDLGRQHAHYDVIVMLKKEITSVNNKTILYKSIHPGDTIRHNRCFGRPPILRTIR